MREGGWVGWEYYPTTGPDNDGWDGETRISRLGARVLVTVKDLGVIRGDNDHGTIGGVDPV